MSAAWQYYIITLLVYAGVNMIAVWGLNLQFGVGGILSFGFIILQSAGAYIAAVLSLGAAVPGNFQSYILGSHLPWPIPLLAGGLAGGLLALVVGALALRLKRIDYQGMTLLTVSLIVTVVVTDYPGLLNGSSGLAGVPKPLASTLNLGYVSYGWFYAALTGVITLLTYVVVRRLSGSPWGRQLRAIRENPSTARGLGINLTSRRLQAFVAGGVLAGVSGALLIEFIGAWAPSSWTTGETFLFFTALVIGGRGNNLGVALGSVVVFTIIIDGIEYLPIFSYTTVAEALQLVAIGIAFVAFIAVRPDGLLPERPRRFGIRPRPSAEAPARLAQPAREEA